MFKAAEFPSRGFSSLAEYRAAKELRDHLRSQLDQLVVEVIVQLGEEDECIRNDRRVTTAEACSD